MKLLISCFLAAMLFKSCTYVASAEESAAQDKDWHNTDALLAVMYDDQESIGPSPSYWSQREMPRYIQNGCTEDVIHGKPACPF